QDLPLAQFGLTILLEVGKFFCLNETCRRRIFTERLPTIVAPWARRTLRYAEQLTAIALSLGGSAAVRLGQHLNAEASRNTFLHLIARLSFPEADTPSILGVDDFALRKGHQYGTILVNLETHQPIALLPDRSAETLAEWLKAHPGVEILSRDRSKTYKRGMNEGAPEAIQVADRFHLLHNLQETLEKAFKGHAPVFRRVEQAPLAPEDTAAAQPPDPAVLLPTQAAESKRAQRLERYEQVHALRQQGYQIKDIAHHLGMGQRTVYTYLSYETFPEWQPTIRRRGSGLDPYKGYLLEQWQPGHPPTKQLFIDIQQQGYQGSYATVARYTRQLRQSRPQAQPSPETLNDLPGRGPAPQHPTASSTALSARRAAWLFLQRAETLTTEQEQTLEQLCQQPELTDAITLAQGLIELVRQRLPEDLDGWLAKAANSSIKAFQTFAKGLKEDYGALKAALTLDVSNGPVEGLNNRLKMLKRQMFGRAGLDLLAKRFILTS
uniref:ISL3 family transposase n=1 Tax=Halomicronema sp. CCY15110 TaxID=2767773 RepID=UPI0019521561